MDYKSKTANDKEISIYYFSATGNSLKLSQDIAAAFGGAGLFRMTPSAGITASDSRIVGFIFPVYMGGLPGIVRRFLESYPFRKGVYYFSIGTYYTYKGCAVSVVDKIMSGKGVRLDYGYNLPTVGNCLKEYEVSSVRRTKILERAELYTSRIIDDLKKGKRKKPFPYCRLLELLEVSGVRTDGMLAVSQLSQRFGIAGRDGGAGFPVFLGQGVFQGGVIDIRRFHMAVEKAGQVEAFFRQVGSVPLEPHALLFRQRQPDGIVLVELHFHVFLPVTDGR